MPQVFDEHTQFMDTDGKPLVNGSIYIGDQNADPVTNPQTIYSDRALTTPLSNPQALDSYGRSTNKVWVGGAYSMRIDNSTGVQQYQELDNGETSTLVPIELTSVAGSNTITATDALGASAYVDRQLYLMRTVLANTGAVTININSIGAIDMVKNQDQALLENELEADQNLVLMYNGTTGDMDLINPNTKNVAFYQTADIASAATTDVWQMGGNNGHITGTTGITSFGTAPNAGAVFWATFDDAVTITHSGNLNLPSFSNYTTEAGDVLRIYANTTTQFNVEIFKINGRAVVEEGALVFISTQDITGSQSEIAFTGLDSTYETYVIQFSGLRADTDDVMIELEVGTGATPTYQTTNYFYGVIGIRSQSGVNQNQPGGVSTSHIELLSLTGATEMLGNAAGEHASGTVEVFQPASTSYYTSVRFKGTWHRAADGEPTSFDGHGSWQDTTAVTAVRLVLDSGNWNDGRATLYGLKTSA